MWEPSSCSDEQASQVMKNRQKIIRIWWHHANNPYIPTQKFLYMLITVVQSRISGQCVCFDESRLKNISSVVKLWILQDLEIYWGRRGQDESSETFFGFQKDEESWTNIAASQIKNYVWLYLLCIRRQISWHRRKDQLYVIINKCYSRGELITDLEMICGDG